MLEIYNRKTEKKINLETEKYFRGYGVVVSLAGQILLIQNGCIVCSADKKYGVRVSS